jgi:hypothetical protein
LQRRNEIFNEQTTEHREKLASSNVASLRLPSRRHGICSSLSRLHSLAEMSM